MLLSDFYTLESVAHDLGVAYKTLYARVKRGQINTHSFGRLRLIDRMEYERIKREMKFNKVKPRGKTERAQFLETYRGAYSSWRSMISRCSNPKDRAYPTHGGRGIKVCEKWHIFEEFLADMGDRPPGLTLERIDNEGDYEPHNCKWATWSEQNRNKRPWGSVSGRKPK